MSLPLAPISHNIPSPVHRPTAAKRKGVPLEFSTTAPSKSARAHSPVLAVKEERTASPLRSTTPLPSLPSHPPLPSSAAPTLSTLPIAILPSSPVVPVWCSCGNCADDLEKNEGAKRPVCCLDVAVGGDITYESEGVCEGEEAKQLLRAGVSVADFLRFSPRVFTKAPRPLTWEECNDAQRRLMLYAAFHELIYRGGRKGQRDAMPECIKQRVREAFPRK